MRVRVSDIVLVGLDLGLGLIDLGLVRLWLIGLGLRFRPSEEPIAISLRDIAGDDSLQLVAWSSGRTSVFGRCAFAVLRLTCS